MFDQHNGHGDTSPDSALPTADDDALESCPVPEHLIHVSEDGRRPVPAGNPFVVRGARGDAGDCYSVVASQSRTTNPAISRKRS
jgi:hypothetical protein